MRRHVEAYFLLEALIAMVIFAVGSLGLANLYAKLHARGQDAQYRILASNYANDLLGIVIADNVNARCYTAPTQGACTSAQAVNYRNTWLNDVSTNLPGAGTTPPTVTIDGNNRVTITINWQRNQDPFAHNHVVMGQL